MESPPLHSEEMLAATAVRKGHESRAADNEIAGDEKWAMQLESIVENLSQDPCNEFVNG